MENLKNLALFKQLGAGDFLFVDSSHHIKAGNDVLFLFLNILPTLANGVIIHFHDIFLPYEYPTEWLITQRWNWTEQYLLQAILQESSRYQFLWAGYYLQQTLPGFNNSFRYWGGGSAKSVWLRRIGKGAFTEGHSSTT